VAILVRTASHSYVPVTTYPVLGPA
jgi:hypothetical protein